MSKHHRPDNFQDNAYLQPLRLTTHQNMLLPLFIGLLHSVTLMLLLPTALPSAMRNIVFASVLLHGVMQLYRYRPGRAAAVREILLAAVDTGVGDYEQWWLRTAHHTWLPAQLCNDAFIHPRLLCLHYHSASGRQRVVVLRTADNADSFRRLLVRLRQPIGG